ncbi:hypothetical protein MKW92_021318, partial [Papaver armeniacum]
NQDANLKVGYARKSHQVYSNVDVYGKFGDTMPVGLTRIDLRYASFNLIRKTSIGLHCFNVVLFIPVIL